LINPIRQVRKELDWISQRDFGFLIDKSQSLVAKWEAGETLPTQDQIDDINEVLEIVGLDARITIERLEKWREGHKRNKLQQLKRKVNYRRRDLE